MTSHSVSLRQSSYQSRFSSLCHYRKYLCTINSS